jgi:uroporphyrinogen-III synthase
MGGAGPVPARTWPAGAWPAESMRVIVTRPRAQALELADRLRRLGHVVVLCPLVKVEPLSDEPLDFSGYDWLVVTSPNGAAEVARRRRGRLPRVAAIGPGTGRALAERGIRAELLPEISTQEGLVAALPRPAGRVALAAAEGARRHLVDELGAEFVPLYRTIELRPSEPPVGDLVVLASASAARALAALDLDIPAVSIGPETSAAARSAGIRVVAEARTHDLPGLVAAVASVAR